MYRSSNKNNNFGGRAAGSLRRKTALALALCFASALISGCTMITPAAPAVCINEVVSSNGVSYSDEALGSPDWIELFNPSAAARDISGWSISDSSGSTGRFTFPSGSSVPAHGYLMLLCFEGSEGLAEESIPEGMLCAGFDLSRKGESLLLSDSEGKALQRLVVPELSRDIAYARAEDGSYGYALPTFGGANGEILDTLAAAEALVGPTAEPQASTAAPHGVLRLTELVNGGSGWAEIGNFGSEAVTLSGYYLTDDIENAAKWQLPEDELAPGEYAVIELTASNDGEPYAADFKLGSADDMLCLFNADGSLECFMSFDPEMPDPVSAVAVYGEGGDAPNGQTPCSPCTVAYTADITRGEANEGVTFPTLEWREDADDTLPIVVNEVLPDNKYGIMDAEGDREDWAELYNRSDAPVSLAGYYLTDNLGNPDKWALPDITMQPGEYLLVFLSGKDGAEGELHASFRLSDTDDGVFISTYRGMLISGIPVPEGIAPGVSVGRGEDGGLLFYGAPTPGGANTSYGFTAYEGLGGFDPDSVYISEVCGVSAPRSGGSDWVELFNAASGAISLEGWQLTEDPAQAGFPLSGSVSPGEFKLITLRDVKDPETGRNRTPGISCGGETLYLVDTEGAVRDVFATGALTLGVTSGRENLSSDGARVFFVSATPGYKNASPLSSYVAAPEFGSDALYCSAPFSLELSCASEGAVIRYTLDGSVPTEGSRAYSGPINVSNDTVVRARAFLPGLVPSETVTRTYLFGSEHTLPVVSIVLKPSDYDEMYVAEMSPNGGVTHGPEVACGMTYYIDGKEAFSTGAGVRVSGASTSILPQKSLGLYFRAGYGRSSLDYPLFKDCPVTSFRSLVLRNSGQDAHSARIRDSYMSRICQGLDIEVAYVQPVIVYVNGDYRGIYDLKENLNEDYLVSHYGSERSTVDIIKRNGGLLAGSKDGWYALKQLCLTGNFSNQADYERLTRLVDADSIIDYLVARTYFYDGDMFNQKYWRATDGTLKWRAVFFDSDCAMAGSNPAGNILPKYFDPNGVPAAHGSLTSMHIYCALVQNGGWRDKFILRYVYLTEYVFNPENALPIFDSLVAEYTPEINAHIARWPGMTASYSAWQQELASLRSCIANRQSYALQNLCKLFSLTSSQLNEYKSRAAAIAAGRDDPGGSFIPAPVPTPAPTPTPGPTATPAPSGTASTPVPTATPEP